MLALCLMLFKTYYAQNYAGIIGLGLIYMQVQLQVDCAGLRCLNIRS